MKLTVYVCPLLIKPVSKDTPYLNWPFQTPIVSSPPADTIRPEGGGGVDDLEKVRLFAAKKHPEPEQPRSGKSIGVTLGEDEWAAIERLKIVLQTSASGVVERMISAVVERGELIAGGESSQTSVYLSPEIVDVIEAARARCDNPRSLGAIARSAVRQCLGAMAFRLDVLDAQRILPHVAERKVTRLDASNRRRRKRSRP